MSDIYLKPTSSGEDIIVNAGQPQMTGGLDNAVYMSLFTADFWGNDLADMASVYDSGIPAIIGAGILSNKTRLDIIAEAQRVTAWMVSAGIVESFEITAEIPTVGTLYLSVKANEPQRTEEFKYGINWDTQKVNIINSVPDPIKTTRVFTFISDLGETFISDSDETYRSDTYIY